jgi:hypothetical protein
MRPPERNPGAVIARVTSTRQQHRATLQPGLPATTELGRRQTKLLLNNYDENPPICVYDATRAEYDRFGGVGISMAGQSKSPAGLLLPEHARPGLVIARQ